MPQVTTNAETAPIETPKALQFINAGDARFTVVSGKTGARYTYRVRLAKEKPGYATRPSFVSLLTGPDNTADYAYMGILSNGVFRLTAASRMRRDSAPVIAFTWLISRLSAGMDLIGAQLYHAGRCGRCGRLLTVPESVQSGYGPECIGKI